MQAAGDLQRLDDVREPVLRGLIRLFVIALGVGVAVNLPVFVTYHRERQMVFSLGTLVVLVALDRVKLPYRRRAQWYLVSVAVGTTTFLLNDGLSLGPTLAGFSLPFLAALFLDLPAAVASFVWWLASIACVGILDQLHIHVVPPNPTEMRMQASSWPFLAVSLVITGGPIAFVAHRLVSNLGAALESRQKALSDLQRAQETLAMSERLNTLGLLAGGIAHDLNNLLTVIAGEVSLAKGMPDEARDAVLQASEAASQLTSQLLLSAGKVIARPRPVDLYRTLQPVLKALTRLLPETINVVVEPAGEPLVVVADPVLLQQAILNLAVNARDAMPAGGQILIHFEKADRKGVSSALLRLRDTGTGMDPETLARATDAFFTTKPRGHGTGLGLFNVRSTVESLGGKLEIASAVGQGTTVTLVLPTSAADAEVDRASGDTILGDGRTVLLVEDNLRVRAVAYEALQRHGYRVLETGEAARAIEIIDGTPRLDVLVSDLVLRDGDGLAIARRLLARHPHAGALIMSGYAPSDEDRASLRRQEFPLLQKPFTPRELVAAVAKAISAALDGERSAVG